MNEEEHIAGFFLLVNEVVDIIRGLGEKIE